MTIENYTCPYLIKTEYQIMYASEHKCRCRNLYMSELYVKEICKTNEHKNCSIFKKSNPNKS